MDKDKFEDVTGKTVKRVVKRDNGCLLMLFTDNTFIGIYNKGEFSEENFELGISFHNWNKEIK